MTTHARVWLAVAALGLAAVMGPGAAADAPRPRVWAIVIGIERHRDPELPGRRGAVRDANRVRSWFLDTAGWGGGSVLLMTPAGNERPGRPGDPVADLAPTAANLDWAFRDWLGARVGPGDIVAVYYAGRAVVAEGRAALLPLDARPGGPGWSLANALDGLAGRGENPIACWLDVEPLPGKDGGGGVLDRLPEEVARWPDVTAWATARGQPDGAGGLATAILAAMGTREQPRSLLACLQRLGQDAALQGRGFRAVGGVPAGLTLWSGRVRAAAGPAPRLLLQRGHDGPVTFAAFTADGDRLVTGGADSALKVWRFGDRVLLRALHVHTVGVAAAALSPDGRYLVSGDPAGRLLVHDLAEGRSMAAGPPHPKGIARVAFLPEGSRYATIDDDGATWLGDAADPARRPVSLGTAGTALATARRPGPAALAVVDQGRGVRIFGADGAPLRDLPLKVDAVAAAALTPDGRLLALGDDAGGLSVHAVETGREVARRQFAGAIAALEFSAAGALAVGTDRGIALLETPDGPAPALPLTDRGRAAQLTFSGDGRWLAGRTAEGGVHLWRLAAGGPPEAVRLAGADAQGRATSLAFPPDGRSLAAGDGDGGLRSWDLPGGAARPAVPSYRGKVVGVSISAGRKDPALDGRDLLQVDLDGGARLWDLREGGMVPILARDPAGECLAWTAGAILPDRAGLVLTTRGGDVLRLDWPGPAPAPAPAATALERPAAEVGGPSGWGFGIVAVAPDGRSVAAGSRQGPLARVWDVATGRPTRTIRDHGAPLTAVGFSADSTRLLTAGLDGTARVWEVPAGDGSRPVAVCETPDDAVTAAAFLPGKGPRLVTGHRSGKVRVWEVREGRPRPEELGLLDGEVRAIACDPGGSWAAAAGVDRSLRLWTLGASPRKSVRLTPQHDEQVNALAAWPDGSILASGSDDTTVRLWRAGGPGLLGTLSASAAPGSKEWVVYTEDGLFDASAGGEGQVTWLRGGRVEPLEQSAEGCRVFRLADRLRRGDRPRPEAAAAGRLKPPPGLAIDPPAPGVGAARDAELTITLGEPGLAGLRLYQDGIPVLEQADFEPAGPSRFRARVQLRPGINRFYAMAGREGAAGGVDGRSREVAIAYGGPGVQGRLHVLALGVSKYRRRALRYADRDADAIAAFLHDHGVEDPGAGGLKLTLLNEKVTTEAVEAAFDRLRKEVRRPEDAVVVFLAGHTDVERGRFRLLLPGFPFAADEPAQAVIRGEAAGPAAGRGDGPGATLPYALICRKLAQLPALQRLVVVDACQSGAILDDPGVRLVQRLLDDDSRRARTSYILAARAGEAVGEAEALRHGLLTYTLLRGMGADLEAMPDLPAFRGRHPADLDGDGVITTEELREFAQAALPALMARYPEVAARAGTRGGPPTESPAPRVRQGVDESFPLVRVGKPPR